MSYDVTFHPSARNQPEYPHNDWCNYTSNVSGMWATAIGENLGDLIERAGDRNADLIEPLRRGVERMTSDPDTYRAMNPANGWGDYEGALGYLRWMLDMCEANPDGFVEVSR